MKIIGIFACKQKNCAISTTLNWNALQIWVLEFMRETKMVYFVNHMRVFRFGDRWMYTIWKSILV
jgi:hypothetical protein